MAQGQVLLELVLAVGHEGAAGNGAFEGLHVEVHTIDVALQMVPAEEVLGATSPRAEGGPRSCGYEKIN